MKQPIYSQIEPYVEAFESWEMNWRDIANVTGLSIWQVKRCLLARNIKRIGISPVHMAIVESYFNTELTMGEIAKLHGLGRRQTQVIISKYKPSEREIRELTKQNYLKHQS